MTLSPLALIYAPIVEAIAVVATAVAAIWALKAWRREMVGRRRADLATDALVKFYKARDVIAYVRTPGSIGNAGNTRVRQPLESEDEARSKDSYYVPIERLIEHSAFFAELNAKRYEFMAVFGIVASRPFDVIHDLKSTIHRSAYMLIISHGRMNGDKKDRGRRQEWENNIGWFVTDDDSMAQTIERAVSDMETTCKPAIMGSNALAPTWKLSRIKR